MSDHLTDERLNTISLSCMLYRGEFDRLIAQAREANRLRNELAICQEAFNAQARTAGRLRIDLEVEEKSHRKLRDEFALLKERLAVASTPEYAAMSKVVAWAEKKVDLNTRLGLDAHKSGRPNRHQFHFCMVDMFESLIRHIKSGEWAKEDA